MAKQDYTPSNTMLKLDFIAREVHELAKNDSRSEVIVGALIKAGTEVASAGIEIVDPESAANKVADILRKEQNAAALTQTIRLCKAIIDSSERNTADWALAHRPYAVAKYMTDILNIPETKFSDSKQKEIEGLLSDY